MKALSGLSGLSGLVNVGSITPLSFDDLILWLRADGTLFQNSDGTTPADEEDDPVGYVFDHSGNSNHHVQATADSRPLLKLNAQNGLPVLDFDGTDDFFIPSLDLSGTGYEAFIVLKIDVDPPATAPVSGLWTYSNDASLRTHYPFTDGVIYDNFGTDARKTTVNPTPTLENWHLYNVTSITNEWTSRLNGTQIFTTATNTVGMSTAANSRLGLSVLGVNLSYLTGQFAELFIYSRKLEAIERANLTSYAINKWGI